ncbi:MAG: bifunctional UDP-N-acetylglucosamine diphosphorylase/glucosamine-1-phosphate N-acetyltransferase GlmU, partial [Anaerolineae bacterium]
HLSVVILAAGQSKRLHSKRSKVLHQVAGKPMIFYSVSTAEQLSTDPPVLVVGHGEDQVRATLGSGVAYVRQERRLGTGHAVLQAREMLLGHSEAVFVCFGDMPLLKFETLRAVAERFQEKRPAISMLTVLSEDSMGFGRVVRDSDGRVAAVVEEAVATPEQLAIRELNCSVYCFQADWLWDNLPRLGPSPKGEYYLTDMVEMAYKQGLPIEAVTTNDVEEVLGINNRVQLAQAERIMRRRINEALMLSGVTMTDPATTYIDYGVTVAEDTVILPNTCLWGETQIGSDCVIGPNTVLRDCRVEAGCTIEASYAEGALIEAGCTIGPFARIRRGSVLAEGVHMGSFGEVKNATLGRGAKMGHFSYVGDASVGAEANIGAGAVTCNFNGKEKQRTEIGEGAFIGSGAMLVAPLHIGARATIGAGAVVTRDVPADTLVYGVPARPKKRRG